MPGFGFNAGLLLLPMGTEAGLPVRELQADVTGLLTDKDPSVSWLVRIWPFLILRQ